MTCCDRIWQIRIYTYSKVYAGLPLKKFQGSIIPEQRTVRALVTVLVYHI